MRKTVSTVAVLVVTLGMATSAEAGGAFTQGWGMAPQTSIYAGGALGMSHQSQFDEGNTKAGKLYGGVRLNRAIGFEAGYTKLGEAEGAGLNEPGGRLPATLKSDTHGIYAAGVGYVPIAPRVELLGKAGAMWWSQDNSKTVTSIDSSSTSADNGLSPLLGVGAQYRLSPNWQLRGEWEHLFNSGEAEDYQTDMDILTVGVHFTTL